MAGRNKCFFLLLSSPTFRLFENSLEQHYITKGTFTHEHKQTGSVCFLSAATWLIAALG